MEEQIITFYTNFRIIPHYDKMGVVRLTPEVILVEGKIGMGIQRKSLSYHLRKM